MLNDGKLSGDAKKTDFRLLPLEKRIIALTVDGYSAEETAEDVGIDQAAVGVQLASIYRKLHVSNQFELILFAVHHQLIDASCDQALPSPRKKPRLKNKVWSKSPV